MSAISFELDAKIPDGPLIGELQKGGTILHEGKKISPSEVQGLERRGRCVVYSGDTSPNHEFYEKLGFKASHEGMKMHF